MLVRKTDRILLPDPKSPLRRGDRLLFCGSGQARSRMLWTLQNSNALDYVLTGESHHPGTLWRWGTETLASVDRPALRLTQAQGSPSRIQGLETPGAVPYSGPSPLLR